jgi:intracellular septation protein A
MTSSDRGKYLAEFFQEDNGKYSTMRAMSFIALIAAIVFGAITMTSKDSEGKYITTTFLVAAFAPKAIQRFAERL